MVKPKRECVTTFLDLMMNCNHNGLPSLVGGTILIFLVKKLYVPITKIQTLQKSVMWKVFTAVSLLAGNKK